MDASCHMILIKDRGFVMAANVPKKRVMAERKIRPLESVSLHHLQWDSEIASVKNSCDTLQNWAQLNSS